MIIYLADRLNSDAVSIRLFLPAIIVSLLLTRLMCLLLDVGVFNIVLCRILILRALESLIVLVIKFLLRSTGLFGIKREMVLSGKDRECEHKSYEQLSQVHFINQKRF